MDDGTTGPHMSGGKTLDQFVRGETILTCSRTITESDVMMFAALTGDFSELHTNEEFARRTPFGERIAHGALVFSISVGLTVQTGVLDGTLIAFARVQSLRFVKPVRIGDSIAVTKTVTAVEEKGPAQGLLTFDTRVRNQRGEVVLAYIDQVLVARRAAPPAVLRDPIRGECPV